MSNKKYFILFGLGGKYSGCYTTLSARNFEEAKTEAARQYGLFNIGSILGNEEKAMGKAKAYGLKKI